MSVQEVVKSLRSQGVGKESKTVRVLFLESRYSEPLIVDVDDRLEVFQGLVGGMLELIRLDRDIDLFVNEEAYLFREKMTPTLHIPDHTVIVGPVFVARRDSSGNTISLTDQDISRWREFLKSSLAAENESVPSQSAPFVSFERPQVLIGEDLLISRDITGPKEWKIYKNLKEVGKVSEKGYVLRGYFPGKEEVEKTVVQVLDDLAAFIQGEAVRSSLEIKEDPVGSIYMLASEIYPSRPGMS